nr:reverse transcriptase domain-containing protein [Tanacetum cinerariifolium]
KDYAKTVKNQSKPGNIEHEIGSQHLKPFQRAFFYNNQANEAKFEPEIRTIEEVVPMVDRTMEELLQAPMKGRSDRRCIPNIVEPEIQTIAEIVPMADRTMEELLQAPTEGDVPNDAIKLMLFSYSLEGTARVWYEKEPPNSILTWDDLVNKFVNQFFPPSKTTHMKNEISHFTQRFEETFREAGDYFKEMLRACPHHGFSELTQIDTFYNGLTEQDQDSLNAAAGGNLLNKTNREALKIIENKSKVCYSRSKSNVSRVNTNSRNNVSKIDDRIDKLADQISNLVEIVNKQVIAPTTEVEKTCVTCGGAHAYYECIATDSNPSSVCATTGSYNQVTLPNRFKELLRAYPHHGFSELTQIDTFYNGLTEQDQDSLNAALGGNLLNKTTREALKIIENKSKVHYSRNKSNVARVNTNSRDVVCKTDNRIDKLADQISNLVEIVNKQVVAPAKVVEKVCVTCRGAHAYYECIATDSNTSSVYAETGSYNQVSPLNRVSHQIPPPGFVLVQNNPSRYNQNQGQGNYFNQANNFNQGNNFRGNNFQNNQGYRAQMKNALNFQNQGFQNQPFSVPNNQIPPSELSSYIKSNEIEIKTMQSQINVLRNDFSKQEENLRKNLNDDMRNILSSFFQNQPSTSGTLPSNTIPNPKESSCKKDKLFKLAKVPLNENCSAMLLKKLLEKLGDPGKFLIPCDFPGMEECHALADLGASINLMPLSIKRKLLLPELTPTRMTLELADRSITYPKGVAEDVFVKVGKFHFLTDFVVVDFKADPRVALILRRSFLRTGRALIDVYAEEITLKYNPKSSSPTLVSDDLISEKVPIVKSSSLTLTLFRESDFSLDEIKEFLNNDSIPTGIENLVYDLDGDILFLEKLLNEDPCSLFPWTSN